MIAEPASTANDSTPSRFQPTWLALLGFGLATRLIVVVLGCFLALPESSAKSRVVHSPHNDGMNLRHLAALSSGSRRWIEPWYRWDAMWYLDISQRGYSYRPGSESSVAFMPLLPLLIKFGETVGFDPYWTGLLIPNLAFVVGLALFGRGVLRVTESAATTWRACILLVAFPSSFYFSAPYQESLCLALTAASLLAWLNHRPAQSAVPLVAASAARLTALSMSLGLVLEWALDLIRGRPARHSAWLVAIAGTVGAALFFGYLTLRFHDPLLHLKAHAAWLRKTPSVPQLLGAIWSLVRVSMVMLQKSAVFTLSLMLLLAWLCHKPLRPVCRRLAGPLFDRRTASVAQEVPKSFSDMHPAWIVACGALLLVGIALLGLRAAGLTVDVLSTLHMVAYSRDLLATILFLGLGIHAFLKRGPLWGCMVLVPILQALASGSILSMTRVVLSSYPGFGDAAEIASNRAVFGITVVVCLFAQFVLLTSYVNWVFVA
ncbi:MAG: mannosyltransferase family protein [Isosphaeraceae bacterium]